jgi:transcriptional adapter 2-alpha
VPRTDIAGYLPLRGDFDVEWENDAEAVLADLDFADGEHATETELKLKILDIYNAKLDERERRKAFVVERGLLDYKALLAAERRRPRAEREVYDAFRPFARFHSPREHEDLVRGIILEQR